MKLTTKAQSSPNLNSEKGNVILWALATAAAGIISALVITPMFRNATQQVSIQNSKSAFESLLQGSLDYTVAGIKNKWCFTGSMLQDSNCNLLHDGNIERLMLSLDTVQFIKTFMRVNVDYQGNIVLQKIHRTVPFSQISDAHPLYTLVQSIPSGSIESIEFDIERIVDIDEPAKSREVILSARISFVGSEKISGMFAEAKLSVFPRELNSFSLLLPNDLHIGSGAPNNNYDSSITGNPGTGQGLIFLSPVFVNGNIFLPPQTGTPDNTGLTFADRVFAAGNLFEGVNVFNSRSAGGPNDQLLSKLQGFGGFLNGIEYESQRDRGLDFLANLSLPVQPPQDLFDFCRERTMARLELSYTDMTRTLVRTSSTMGVAEFTTGGINDLFPQRGVSRRAYKLTGAMDSELTLGPGNFSDSPIVRLKMELSGYDGLNVPQAVLADMSFQDTVWLKSGANGLRVGVRVDPVIIDTEGDHEPNKFRIQVITENGSATSLGPIKIGGATSTAYLGGPNLTVSVQPFDLGFNYGVNQRPLSTPTLDRNKVNGAVFTVNPARNGFNLKMGNDPIEGWWGCPDMDGTRPECMDALSNITDVTEARKLIPIDGISYAMLARACGNLRDFGGAPGQYPAFGGADWSTSFAEQSPTVWGFTEFDNPTGPAPAAPAVGGYRDATIIFDGSNAGDTPATNNFHVRARIRRCLVDASAKIVAGFFVCDTFEIGPRSTPLKVIGTVITNKLIVDPLAISAGITWSSIYHTLGIEELRRLRILQAMDSMNLPTSCQQNPAEPAWLPNLTMNTAYNYYRCSSSFLRDKADPFKWTTVDPDCGLPTPPPGGMPAGQYKCKGRVTKFYIKEISRRSHQ